MKTFRTLLSATLLFCIFSVQGFAQSVEEGETLFQQNCTSCHRIDSKLIGPALKDITERRPHDWLINFITNSQAVINSGDPYAEQLFEEYNKVIMPPMALSEGEINSVLAYIEAESKAGAEATAAAGEGATGVPIIDESLAMDGTFQLLAVVILLLIGAVLIIASSVLQLVLKLNGVESKVNWNKVNAILFVVFFILLVVGIIYEVNIHTENLLPEAASVHGKDIDQLFNITLVITGIVFIVTQIVLFYFAVKYRGKAGRKGTYYPENNKLEFFWTAIPALVLTVLVLLGFKTWRNVTAPPSDDTHNIEVFAYQFGWQFRYPGPDNELGRSDFRLISATNPLGLDPEDPASADDIITRELHLPVDESATMHFRSRDVIHSFWLPHFRVQMYCQPGLESSFTFIPDISTEEMRTKRKDQEFDYELACNQICGAAHYNMRAEVVVENKEQFIEWLKGQKTFDAEAAKKGMAEL